MKINISSFAKYTEKVWFHDKISNVAKHLPKSKLSEIFGTCSELYISCFHNYGIEDFKTEVKYYVKHGENICSYIESDFWTENENIINVVIAVDVACMEANINSWQFFESLIE